MNDVKEGFVKVTGGRVWYEVLGKSKNVPLLILHGGPGSTHYYLDSLKDLSANRQVIFYDQLGCGKSDRPNDKSLWNVDRFVDELEKVIKALGLKNYHILGHSWGAALGVCFASKKPKELKSIVLADPYLSSPLWIADAQRLRRLLPKKVQKILEKNETAGTYNSPEYKKAGKVFYKRFLYRIDPKPKALKKAAKEEGMDVYHTMWGPKEFLVNGNLKDFDCSDKLSDITIPVNFICGRFDEATPESTAKFAKLTPNSQLTILEDSAHFPFWSERVKFMKTVDDFLEVHD